MEKNEDYVVVQSRDKYTIAPIPKIWLLNKSKFTLGEICEWYCPIKSLIKKSDCYAEVEENWIIKSGVALNTSANIKY